MSDALKAVVAGFVVGWRSVFVRVVRPGHAGCASLEVLRRRSYMRVVVLPGGRVLIFGRLPL